MSRILKLNKEGVVSHEMRIDQAEFAQQLHRVISPLMGQVPVNGTYVKRLPDQSRLGIISTLHKLSTLNQLHGNDSILALVPSFQATFLDLKQPPNLYPTPIVEAVIAAEQSDILLVQGVCIRPEFRRRGICKVLYTILENLGRASGYRYVAGFAFGADEDDSTREYFAKNHSRYRSEMIRDEARNEFDNLYAREGGMNRQRFSIKFLYEDDVRRCIKPTHVR